MSDTTFVDNSTIIVASWLNDVNDTVYGALNGAQTPTAARTALGLGTAALLNTGTSAGKVIVLDGAARLPAVDGSQLTNIVATSVDVTTATGTLPINHGGTGSTTASAALSALGGIPQTGTTGSAVLPSGTTGERDGSPVLGYLRYNQTLSQFEGYGATGWGAIGGGAGQMLGSATIKCLSYNSQTVDEDLTVASGTNASAAGPITITSGHTITVSDGCVLTII